MASTSRTNINLYWVGKAQELADMKSMIDRNHWKIESVSFRSLSRKLRGDGRHVVFVPLWSEGLKSWSQKQSLNWWNTEFVLVRRSDQWHEIDPMPVVDLINRLNVRRIVDWPFIEEDLEQFIQKKIGPSSSLVEPPSPEPTGQVVEFVKGLSSATTVEDLLMLLRNELKDDSAVAPPILTYFSRGVPYKLFFQGQQIQVKKLNHIWPQSLRIRMSDRKDQDYLSNELGRAVLSCVAIPLIVHGPEDGQALVSPATLFLEHSKPAAVLNEFMDSIGEKLQPLTTALDRILLEIDLKNATRTWSQTFDGIQDPIAIFDNDLNMLRHNQLFSDLVEKSDVLLESIRGGFQAGKTTYTQYQHDGRLFNLGMHPILVNPDSKPTTLVAHFTDVTESVQLQSQMIQNEKMVAVGHLAGNIAHELNNPLTGIRSLAQILLAEKEKINQQQQDDLLEVEQAASRSQEIINNLLDFSKGGRSEYESVTLDEIVRRTLPLLKTALRSHVCDVEYSGDESKVSVDFRLVQQVVFNLVNNACQAMGDSGHLLIRMSSVRDNGFIEVIDDGPGIPEDVRPHIFENFFTTKAPGRGTGLGLSMSQKIIKEYGGRIELESKVGEGSTFRVVFPLSSEQARNEVIDH